MIWRKKSATVRQRFKIVDIDETKYRCGISRWHFDSIRLRRAEW